MNRSFRWFGVAATLAAVGCGSDSNTGPTDTTPPSSFTLALQPIDTVSNALYVAAPANDARLFVVSQDGVIRVIKNGTMSSTPFLDIRSTVDFADEGGLLSMAFHPNYASNGLFYVYVTDRSGNIAILRYHVSSGNADVADPASLQMVLSFPHATGNFGGLLMFGPDGMLYASVGDGDVPTNPAQDSSSYLGKLLRIDVNGGSPYAVPSDNPYAGTGHGAAKPEIWAKGLRNPWRYAFDAPTNRLYLADVGNQTQEEINVVPSTTAGVNYGWPLMEGTSCSTGSTCPIAGLQLPALTYPHRVGACTAVIGGFVYRGSALPEINGHYFYSDVCVGGLNSFRYTTDSSVVDKISWNVGTTGHAQSFGRDGSGELYFINGDGVIYKIVRGTTTN